jgi:dTDP-6-deoxy-L-talose 4-dehydrogenase (NAD+)
MKILLTGATGFIGSTFTRLALARGHQLAGLLIPSEQIPANLPPGRDLAWLRGTLDDTPWKDIAAFGPEACLHMAWITTPGIYLESPENFRFLESSIRFLRRIRESGTNQIFGMGTCVEYQVSDKPLSEDLTPVAPATPYAQCKDELRRALEADAAQHGFAFCWGRVFYPYGPGEHPSRLCSSIIRKLSQNEKIVLKTPTSTKDYIYIDDLAAAILMVLEKKFRGTINLGTGIGTSVREIAQSLGEMLGKPGLVEEANPPAMDAQGDVVADASRLRGLGWRPAHDLRGGLQRLIESGTWTK